MVIIILGILLFILITATIVTILEIKKETNFREQMLSKYIKRFSSILDYVAKYTCIEDDTISIDIRKEFNKITNYHNSISSKSRAIEDEYKHIRNQTREVLDHLYQLPNCSEFCKNGIYSSVYGCMCPPETEAVDEGEYTICNPCKETNERVCVPRNNELCGTGIYYDITRKCNLVKVSTTDPPVECNVECPCEVKLDTEPVCIQLTNGSCGTGAYAISGRDCNGKLVTQKIIPEVPCSVACDCTEPLVVEGTVCRPYDICGTGVYSNIGTKCGVRAEEPTGELCEVQCTQ